MNEKLKNKLNWHMQLISENYEEICCKEKYILNFSGSDDESLIYKEALENILDAANELRQYVEEDEFGK